MTRDAQLDGDELIIARHLDASAALVWEAFTTPAHLAAFWGGDHATIPPDSVHVDLRVGGVFQLQTRGPDGNGRLLRFTYEVIDEPRLLVLAEPQTGIWTEIRLHPAGTGTDLVVHQRRLPPELQTEQAKNGLEGILDRLDDLVILLEQRAGHS